MCIHFLYFMVSRFLYLLKILAPFLFSVTWYNTLLVGTLDMVSFHICFCSRSKFPIWVVSLPWSCLHGESWKRGMTWDQTSTCTLGHCLEKQRQVGHLQLGKTWNKAWNRLWWTAYIFLSFFWGKIHCRNKSYSVCIWFCGVTFSYCFRWIQC